MSRLRLRLVSTVALVAVIAVSCGNSGSSEAAGDDSATKGLPDVPASDYKDETGKGSVVIDTRDNTFTPQYVTVSPGTKLEFENRGRTPHNVIPVEKDEFDAVPTEDLQPDDTAIITFDEPGEYPYYCSLHGTKTKGMTGRIKVEG